MKVCDALITIGIFREEVKALDAGEDGTPDSAQGETTKKSKEVPKKASTTALTAKASATSLPPPATEELPQKVRTSS